MKNSFYLLVSLLLLIGCKNTTEEKVVSRVDTLPFYDDPTFTPKWLSKKSDSLKNFHSIANFSLIDQEGNPITNATFANKIYVANFFFTTCPGICPKMAASMTVLQKEFLNGSSLNVVGKYINNDFCNYKICLNAR
ncbi:SCO family protein, partial [Flavobacterium sp. Arc2]|uniref:SCO family protein n=1 Tax=Flavobacterium sp. Arc2 TaxID=3046685 RepID=UPI00352E9547